MYKQQRMLEDLSQCVAPCWMMMCLTRRLEITSFQIKHGMCIRNKTALYTKV